MGKPRHMPFLIIEQSNVLLKFSNEENDAIKCF